MWGEVKWYVYRGVFLGAGYIDVSLGDEWGERREGGRTVDVGVFGVEGHDWLIVRSGLV